MIRINLLPFRQARKKDNLRHQLIIFLIILAATIGGLFYLHTYWKNQIAELNTEIARNKKELEKQNKLAKQVEDIRKQLEELKKKLEAIDQLELKKKDTFNILDKLTDRIVKNRMWLTNLKTVVKVTRKKGEDSTPKVNISVDGIAMDQPTVADFIANLEAEKLFAGVTLVSITKVEVKKGLALKQFKVEFIRRQEPKKKPEDGKDGKDTKKKKKKK